MAFRDHLTNARLVQDEVSLIHGVWNYSREHNHPMLLFDNITEANGHKIAVNMLTRDRLCEAIGIEPDVYIDTLAWAMKNPTEPVIVSPSDAPVYDCMQDEVNLTVLPIPHHLPQDRGRYMSASVIIAEVDGRRNMSFHRQFLRDESHLVVRLVPRHLRTMVDEARSKGHEVKIAIVNAPDPVVLLAGAMSFDEPIDELSIAAALHEKLYDSSLELVELPNGIQVPANAEYAMWG